MEQISVFWLGILFGQAQSVCRLHWTKLKLDRKWGWTSREQLKHRKLKRLSDTEHLISCWDSICCRYKMLKIFSRTVNKENLDKLRTLARVSEGGGLLFLIFVLKMLELLECQTFHFHEVTTGFLLYIGIQDFPTNSFSRKMEN